MIHLSRSEVVDPAFVSIVEQALNNVLIRERPSEVYLIQIGGWFDYKWQAFSGTFMHEIAVWRHNLTLPPFHPSRVVSQTHFDLRSDGSGYNPSQRQALHIHQASRNNLG